MRGRYQIDVEPHGHLWRYRIMYVESDGKVGSARVSWFDTPRKALEAAAGHMERIEASTLTP